MKKAKKKYWLNGQTSSKAQKQQLNESKYLPDKIILTKMFISSSFSTLNILLICQLAEWSICRAQHKDLSCYCYTNYAIFFTVYGNIFMVLIMRKSYRSLFCSSNDFPYIKMESTVFFSLKKILLTRGYESGSETK